MGLSCKKFAKYCVPETNEMLERFKFQKRVQKEGKPFDEI